MKRHRFCMHCVPFILTKMQIYISLYACLNCYKVVDFNVHISEAGENYNEKIEVDRDKQTELFEVPAHPGVDRSDVLHDFKQVRSENPSLNLWCPLY